MVSLLWILLAGLVLTAALAGPLVLRRRAGRAAPPDRYQGESLRLALYRYDESIQGLDDLTARVMSTYRETGTILDYLGDDQSLNLLVPARQTFLDELSRVTMSACEVRRLEQNVSLYFFTGLRKLTCKTPQAKELCDCLCQALAEGHTAVLEVERDIWEE